MRINKTSLKVLLLGKLSSIGRNSHAKESMFAFFTKKIGSSIVKIGENYAKNKINPPKQKKKEAVIIESNVIIPEGAK